MKHLDQGRLEDAIDGRIDPADAAHVEACVHCRTQLEELRAVLQQVTDVMSPAPSPLFWEHFRTRVARAIDEPRSTRSAWLPGPRFRWLAAAFTAVTVVLVTLPVSLDPTRPGDSAASDSGALVLTPDADDVDQDEAWALVRSLADGLDYQAVHDAGVTPAPGSVERAAMELSPGEQTALIELLEQEMKRTDS